MRLRRVAVAASALVLLGSAIPVAYAVQSSQKGAATPVAKHLPRPERPRDAKHREFDPHSLLVRFKPGASATTMDRALTRRGAKRVGDVPGTGYVKVQSRGAAPDVLRHLRTDPTVADVSLNFKRRIAAVPNDEFYGLGDQSYLDTVRLPQAWDKTKGSTSQIIAVVDTGVNGLHPDLQGRTVTGYSALTRTIAAAGTDTDDNGHGSMVAGIAAANTNNGIGIAGAAWTGRVMPVKVLRSDGTGYDSDIVAGITWAADNGAKVINLSLGAAGDSVVLHDAVKYAIGKGAVVVAAAGDSGDDIPQYPAAYPEVLAVGATDVAGNLTDFSSWGDWIDLAAPGFHILSTGQGQDYNQASGTSFSAPIVSGAAALVRSAFPSWTPAQVMAQLRATARDAGPRGIDPSYGYGVLDAYFAVGGTWAPEFPARALGTGEPNDVPARATAFATSTTGTLATEGDVDWYHFDLTTQQAVSVQVRPPAYEADRPQNVDPILAVYDEDLRLVGQGDDGYAGAPEALLLDLVAGSYYVSVRNHNGGADTRPYVVSVDPSSVPLFYPAQGTTVGSRPQSVAIGDVTGDERADVLLATGYDGGADDYKLFVFAQNADGSLAPFTRYPTASPGGGGLALLDADGDGRRDAALATGAGVQIFRQSQAGTLASAGLLPGTAGALRLVAADMDADGDTDLVMNGAAGIVLLTHEADGTFAPTTVTTDATGEVEVGDVDGDGRSDVVGFEYQWVRVYHRTDSGWNRTDHDIISRNNNFIEGIEVADVSGDGHADVVATLGGNAPDARLNVFVQNSTGGLDTPAVYLIGDSPKQVEAADVTGDSRIDVVTAHGGWNTLSVLPQQANGTLGTPITSSIPNVYGSSDNVQGLALGDVNGDKHTDAVLAGRINGLVVLRRTGSAPGGEQVWVRDVSPADFAGGAALSTPPSVTFQRAVDAASVSSSSVRLLDGVTGAALPASVSFDAGSGTATVTPAAALQDNTPYRVVVDGVRDTSGAVMTQPFSSTFRTVDAAPGRVSNLKATGALRGASLSWTVPSINDLDQVIVRRATGSTAPSSPTSGTAVYAGTGSSVTVTGLSAGSTYTFRAWVRDRSGKLSSSRTVTLTGSAVTISSAATSLTYGGSVKLTGRLTRSDTGAAIVGAAVQLYGRMKGSSTWSLRGTATSSSTGDVSLTSKPSWSLDYQWVYRGSAGYTGADSALSSVGVATAITAAVSKTSFPLGQSVVVSGTVSPAHAGSTVTLQRLVDGVWSTSMTRTLSSTSSYSFTLKPSSRKTYTYRVYLPAHTNHLAGYSPSRSFTIL